jgi:hypothetical protein
VTHRVKVDGGPLFLVVTIKPRLDRLAQAEAQSRSTSTPFVSAM